MLKNLTVNFPLPTADITTMSFRIDPLASQKSFGIQKLEVMLYQVPLVTISGAELGTYIEHMDNCEYIAGEETGGFVPTTEDPAIYLNKAVNELTKESAEELLQEIEVPDLFVFLIFLGAFVQLKTMLKMLEKDSDRRDTSNKHDTIMLIISNLLLGIGVAIVYAWRYLATSFAGVEMAEIVYHLNTSLDGSNMTTFVKAIMHGLEVILVVLAVAAVIEYFLKRAGKYQRKVFTRCLMGASIVLAGFGTYKAISQLGLIEYMRYSTEKTTIYEEYYVDGRDIELTFPEQKRNLIYIYLESMETAYSDVAHGGALKDNLIPELTAIAQENVDFSTGGLNGGYTMSGTTFTTGGLVAQTSGMPINTSIMGTNYNLDGEHYLLPGAWTLGDVLEEQGYNQVLMIGSDGNFGGRALYFRGHGNYEIYDHDKIKSIGWLPSDYLVFWGYEDQKLVEFAKVKIADLAEQDEPFNFTMLTVDTHFTDGYRCELCGNEYADQPQYSDVIACSSRQIAGLVAWIQEQDFYEDTTIIISGDHLTMDSYYMEKYMVDQDYSRRTYLAVINPAEGCVERDRVFSTLDLYPTTLAAMGVSIEGERLGMGVNLFSDTPTLCEEYEKEYLDAEFLKNSDLYQTLIY